ncbi:unnamed protein product [Linum trigynum]|uniref:Uncharacterized protein n=1 Tax=Linum trigynum TaxID=586398 RepID=A0AAV2EJQ8_9ROSI
MKELAELIRQATAGVDETYLNTITGEEGAGALFEAQNWLAGRIAGSHKLLLCSSWLQFDLRGVELAGLGKPAWVGVLGGARGNRPCLENFMVLTELAGTVAAAGSRSSMVEAWIRLDEDVMAGLERDPEFLEFASPNPNVIVA